MSQLTPAVAADDHAQGPLDARIVLVEYGDYQCPYCGDAYPQLKAVKQAMGDSLCFVFRNFPLGQAHPQAQRAAEFAEAAATIGRFWEMHDWLYEHQDSLDEPHLIAQASNLGFDGTLLASVSRGDFTARVARDFKSGVRSGVNGTPCLFINGRRYEGSPDADSLLALFESLR